MISIDEINRILSYDKETGIFVWLRTSGGAVKGCIAGTVCGDGYVSIKISGKLYKAHRLAWFIANGNWPTGQIDHINRTRTDNRLCNLRDVSQTENQINCGMRKDNSSGFKGVSFMPKYNKWRACIRVNKKLKHLGCYVSAELAGAAYQNALATFYPQLIGENNE